MFTPDNAPLTPTDPPHSVATARMEIGELRKAVKHKLVDLELDRPGSYDVIIKRLPRPVNMRSMSMALTGHRNGPAYRDLLQEILSVLEAWDADQGRPSPCGVIHTGEVQSN